MAQTQGSDDPARRRPVEAFSHPLRLRILAKTGDEPTSANELSRVLGVRASQVDYHVRVLASLGCLETVGARAQRGASEYLYRSRSHPLLSDPGWSPLPDGLGAEISDALSEAVLDDVRRALGEDAAEQLAEGGRPESEGAAPGEIAWSKVKDLLAEPPPDEQR